jgi:hypothetical protein
MDIFLALNAAFLGLSALFYSLAIGEGREAGDYAMLIMIACCTALIFFSIYYLQ